MVYTKLLQDLSRKHTTCWETEKAQSPRKESQQNPVKPKCARDPQISGHNRHQLSGRNGRASPAHPHALLQASRSRRGYSSQLSLTSTGTVPDLTDRVIRVSFAPEGLAEAPASVPESPVVPGTPSPPDYDTLSTHSRVSASDPPPDYAVAVPE